MPVKVDVEATTMSKRLPVVNEFADIEAMLPMVLADRMPKEPEAAEPTKVSFKKSGPLGEVVPIPRRVPAVTTEVALIFVFTWRPLEMFKLPAKELLPTPVLKNMPAVSMLLVE